jgi:hypothetical protein
VLLRGPLLVVAGVVALSAATALADNDPWPVANARLGYPIYKPVATLGFKISSFGFEPCPGGPSKASLYTTYGSYRGILGSRTKGFGLLEGSPAICSDPAEWTPHGHVWIGAARASLGVYCALPGRCSLAQGRENGFILLWRRGRTRMQMDSAHLALTGLLRVARSLVAVR